MPTLTDPTRRRLAAILLHAHGLLSRAESRFVRRLLPVIAAEDPELARALRGYVVVR